MPGLVPGIYVFVFGDGRAEPGHDGEKQDQAPSGISAPGAGQ
jgi:hypothetical protein